MEQQILALDQSSLDKKMSLLNAETAAERRKIQTEVQDAKAKENLLTQLDKLHFARVQKLTQAEADKWLDRLIAALRDSTVGAGNAPGNLTASAEAVLRAAWRRQAAAGFEALLSGAERDIVRIGEMIKLATREQLPVVHPENPGIAGVTIAELTAPPTHPGADAKNTVIVSTGTPDWDKPSSWTGVLDRSPCGTGTCARMAVLHAKGKLPLQQDFVHESIISTLFTGRLIAETQVGQYRAVIPTISGRAWISGFANYVVDAEDPFPNGFTVGDLWGLNEG